MPWAPDRAAAPTAIDPAGWAYFTPEEAAAVEAIVDRLIPPDPETPGGKDIGCAVFIDRQLAGAYGKAAALYMSGPFQEGFEEQGAQAHDPPAVHYRKALAALDRHCRDQHNGSPFAALFDQQKDAIIADLESGKLSLGGKPGSFFKQILKDTQQGFFADPIYGGRHGRAEDDRLSRRPLRLPRLGRPPQRAAIPIRRSVSLHPDWNG